MWVEIERTAAVTVDAGGELGPVRVRPGSTGRPWETGRLKPAATVAFIYVSSAAACPSSAAISRLDRIRTAWEAFFLQATDGRMRAITGLRENRG